MDLDVRRDCESCDLAAEGLRDSMVTRAGRGNVSEPDRSVMTIGRESFARAFAISSLRRNGSLSAILGIPASRVGASRSTTPEGYPWLLAAGFGGQVNAAILDLPASLLCASLSVTFEYLS